MKNQNFDFFVVVNFKATCSEVKDNSPKEIIKIDAILVDCKTLKVSSKFCEYVKPVHKPYLGSYCEKTTGISQISIDKSDNFCKIYKTFMCWLSCYIINKKIIFVIDNDWHFKTIFPSQCNLSLIKTNEFVCTWINIKKEFKRCEKINKSETDISLDLISEFYGISEKPIDVIDTIHKLLEKMCLKYTLKPTKIIQ